MDQLTAYKVLGLEPNSTTEEVKEAYAALSKKFHPEEYPEQFQEVHEAYVTLTRRRGRRDVQVNDVEEQPVDQSERSSAFQNERQYMSQDERPHMSQNEEQTQAKLDFGELKKEQGISPEAEDAAQEEAEESYSFEEALQKAEREEWDRTHELALEAAAELKVLVSPKYKNDLKAFQGFLKSKKYEPIITRDDFVEKLCEVLDDQKLKKDYYYTLIDFYRLRGCDPAKLSPVGQRLYRILNEQVGMKKPKSPAVYGGVIAGILAGLRAARPSLQGSKVYSILVLLVVLGVLGYLIYRKWSRSHSPLLIQAILAVFLVVSQFAVIMTDFYGTIFGTVENGAVVATLLMFGGLAWLTAIIAVALIKALARLLKRK